MSEADVTPHDVARYMADQLKAAGWVYQETVVYEIEQKFGERFVYVNENGNLAIGKDVLKAFRELTPRAIWSRSERAWRLKSETEGDGRQED